MQPGLLGYLREYRKCHGVDSHELELTRRSLINLAVDLLTADWIGRSV
jgi:hypothetical protein